MNKFRYLKDKNILITGHTGFQGYWLYMFLCSIGCKYISGISLKPNIYQEPLYKNLILKNRFIHNFNLDISNQKNFQLKLNTIKPDIIFHLASQPLVGDSYKDPITTFKTNIMGSVNLLNWAKDYEKRLDIIFITSDKCYKPSRKDLTEDDRLEGQDPYSVSKSIQELLVNSYIKSFYYNNKFIKIATARSGNIYGGGDFTPGRLFPDLAKLLENKNNYFYVRNYSAVRPWQYVLDTIFGYVLIANNMNNDKVNFQSFNFGPGKKGTISVKDFIEIFSYNSKIRNKIKIKINTFKENEFLSLNSNKSKKILKWKNLYSLSSGINESISWYINYYNKNIEVDLFSKQIIKNFLSKI